MAAANSVVVQIARPYANALFDLAQADNKLAEVEAGLTEMSRFAAENQDFARFLRSPVIQAEEKARAVDAILKDAKASELVGNFVRLVARNGRLFALLPMIALFKELAAKARGEVLAEVTSAEPLTEAQVKSLGETLKARIGKTATLSQRVDPTLIGGLVVKVGSQMIDSSLKTKLNAMKIAMKEVG